jgi:hypothetical protein
MEETKIFKYTLPDSCPESFINDKGLNVGEYGVEYFRISKESPPDEEDFIPLFFLPRCSHRVKEKMQKNDYPGLCQMASTSILKTKEDAIRLTRKFKKMGKYIFCGIITNDDGLILVSPSKDSPNHCSFFVYIDANESRIFAKGVYP